MKKLLLFVLLLGLVQVAAAQGPGSGGPTPQSGPTSTPIDGGASLLLAGGAAYAVRKLRARRAGR